MTQNAKALSAAAVAVLSWSTVAAAFKTALNYYTHYEMLTVAAVTATVVFAIMMSLQGKWKSLRMLTRREIISCAMLGVANPALYYLVLFAAYDKLPAQVAQPINYCWPIFLVLLMAAVMHRPVRSRLYIGMALSFAGVAVISLGGSAIGGAALSPYGLMLAFLSAVLWAGYWILNEKLKGNLDETVKLFLSFLAGSILLVACSPFAGCDFSSADGLRASIYVGVMEMGIPFFFFSYALAHADNVALVNQMCYIAPFLSLFFISVIVGETIVATSYIGLALIVGGVVYNRYLAYPARRAASPK